MEVSAPLAIAHQLLKQLELIQVSQEDKEMALEFATAIIKNGTAICLSISDSMQPRDVPNLSHCR